MLGVMHYQTYPMKMKKKKLFLNLLLFACIAFVYSCGKEDASSHINPTLSLKYGGIYTSSDTTLSEGLQITIGVSASSNGGSNLTNLIVCSNDTLILLNHGFNANSLNKDFTISKNSALHENIKITIKNSIGLSKSYVFKLTKGANNWHEINRYNNISLGAQSNTSFGSFLSLGSGEVFIQDSAFLHQNIIDLLYYHNTVDFSTLASPGASIAGIFLGNSSPDMWTIKNTCYFGRTAINVSPEDFANAQNDSLILSNRFVDSGRKAKNLTAGQVWSFQTPTGSFGLIKINNVVTGSAGYVNFDLQIQK